MASDSAAPGALLTAYIDDTLEMLDSDDVLDYFRHKNDLDENLLNKLSDSLLSIKSVMDDAENKHYSNKDVRRWLYKVRDAVHDAEDLLDEIQTEASKSKLLAPEFQTTSSSSSAVSSFDKEVQSRMKNVLVNLESLDSRQIKRELEKNNSGGAKYVYQSEETSSVVEDESKICGRDNDKKVIIDWLLSDNDNGTGGNNLTVISIVGMGGLGKTTLAQLVYNDKSMDDDVTEFRRKAWVCVSKDFDVTKVTRTILEALKLPTSGRENLNTLQVKLKEELTGKKFFLVLDDVWEEKKEKWEALRAPLLHGARGSKILVTTRSEKVASIRQSAYLHPLKKLSEEQSWLLFAKHALYHANSTSEFEEIGRKIIKKCNGLPLALKAIGRLLHDNSSKEEWKRISTSQMWEISDSECDIIPALILSYQFLPSPLKRCFAYLRLRGMLSIEELQNVADPMNALRADLKNKMHLEELSFKWESSSREMKGDGYEIEENVLENLQPPENLKKLCIEYYNGTRFPDWLGNMSINNNIVSLKVIDCKYCVCLPHLKTKLPQHLPSLMKLIIDCCPLLVGAYEKELPGSSYTRLHTLKIWECPDLEIQIQESHPLFNSLRHLKLWNTWNTVEAFPLYLFPRLHKLELIYCRNLERLDVGSGVTSHPLTWLMIEECPKLVSIPPFTLFPSLTKLRLINCPELEWLIKLKKRVVVSHQPWRYL